MNLVALVGRAARYLFGGSKNVMAYTFDNPAWPPGEDWPPGVLPPPCLTLEIGVPELEALITHHDELAASAERDRTHEAEFFHKVRASYLRQRLGAVAVHRLPPNRAGRV